MIALGARPWIPRCRIRPVRCWWTAKRGNSSEDGFLLMMEDRLLMRRAVWELDQWVMQTDGTQDEETQPWPEDAEVISSGLIPSELGDLVGLTSLDLRDNDLSGPLPESLVELVQLRTFVVTANSLCVPDTPTLTARLEGLTVEDTDSLEVCEQP